MKEGELYADLILPLAIPNLYTYSIPEDIKKDALPCRRVVVQFGKKKYYSAIIRRVHTNAPVKYKAKEILQVLDDRSIVTEKQLELWEWISSYYMCHIGEVMIAAMPSGLRLSSESEILLSHEYDGEISGLSEQELLVVEALVHREKISMDEIGNILGLKKTYPLIKSLLDKRVIRLEERIAEKYKPRKIVYVFPSEQLYDEERLRTILDGLSNATAQLRIMMKLIQLYGLPRKGGKKVKRSILLKEADAGSSALKQLESKGFICLKELEESRLDTEIREDNIELLLTEIQNNTLSQIKDGFNRNLFVLLHGVTSSGKTEIYIKLIRETIEQGLQVLYLLPEIALTTQIIGRLKKYFVNRVGVYHSRFNQNEKVEIWKKLMEGGEQCSIVLGARSAVFLPFTKIGLVIVDEEHDSSYKQQDPAPRYHGRDTALMLASMSGAKAILGSATPSVETYWNAQRGKYAFAEINERYGGMALPEIVLLDLAEAQKKKQMHTHFSSYLINRIKEVMEEKKQTILFRNRRGFSPLLYCATCGWIPRCLNCDVSLTYHKYNNHIRCHYCGYHEESPVTCPACGDNDLRFMGYGTEKAEEELQTLLPEARIERMDWDTTRGKYAYHKLISRFEDKEIDILIGTQMITKGLDFSDVRLVGVLNADQLLHFPDFRSYERAYQLMTQVAGRAGRKDEQGKVVIQTFDTKHPVFQMVLENDYKALYEREIRDRELFRYPPFYRLIKIIQRHRDQDLLEDTAKVVADKLQKIFGKRMLGPEYPPISRIRGLYNQNILIKLERGLSLYKVKEGIGIILADVRNMQRYKSVRFVIDVDPQ